MTNPPMAPPSPAPNSLLLADSMMMLRESLAALCAATQEYTVAAQCADASEVLDQIRELRPDVALLDSNLPGMGAAELASQVRQEGHPTRLVLLSSRNDRMLLRAALRGGIDGLVWRSGPSQEVLQALRRVVAGGSYVSPLMGTEEPSEALLERLSPREQEVFHLLVDGMRPKDVALHLGLSRKTIDAHRASILRKMGVRDLASLVRLAMEHHLVSA